MDGKGNSATTSNGNFLIDVTSRAEMNKKKNRKKTEKNRKKTNKN